MLFRIKFAQLVRFNTEHQTETVIIVRKVYLTSKKKEKNVSIIMPSKMGYRDFFKRFFLKGTEFSV